MADDSLQKYGVLAGVGMIGVGLLLAMKKAPQSSLGQPNPSDTQPTAPLHIELLQLANDYVSIPPGSVVAYEVEDRLEVRVYQVLRNSGRFPITVTMNLVMTANISVLGLGVPKLNRRDVLHVLPNGAFAGRTEIVAQPQANGLLWETIAPGEYGTLSATFQLLPVVLDRMQHLYDVFPNGFNWWELSVTIADTTSVNVRPIVEHVQQNWFKVTS